MRICIQRRQDGMAVIVVLALLSILLGYLSFNALTLQRLSRDVKDVEKRQIRRLQTSTPWTNSLTLTNATGTQSSFQAGFGVPPLDGPACDIPAPWQVLAPGRLKAGLQTGLTPFP